MTDHYCDTCGAELSPIKHAYLEFCKRQKRTIQSRLGAMPLKEAYDSQRWQRELAKAFSDAGQSEENARILAEVHSGGIQRYLSYGDDIDEAQRLAGPI